MRFGAPLLSRRRRIALAVFFVYAAVSLAVHDAAPFCEFDMFARPNSHPRAVSFRADGIPAPIGAFADFDIRLPDAVPAADSLQPNGGDQNQSVDEMFSYARAHRTAGTAAGPRVGVEFLLLSTDWDEAAGRPVVTGEVLCRGTARRKS